MITRKCDKCEKEIEVVYNFRSNKKWTRRGKDGSWFPRQRWAFRFAEHTRLTRHGMNLRCKGSHNVAVSKPSKKMEKQWEEELVLKEIAR